MKKAGIMATIRMSLDFIIFIIHIFNTEIKIEFYPSITHSKAVQTHSNWSNHFFFRN